MILDVKLIEGTHVVRVLSFEASSGSLEDLEMLTAITHAHIDGGSSLTLTRADGTIRTWAINHPKIMSGVSGE